jgi:hypothetical protein
MDNLKEYAEIGHLKERIGNLPIKLKYKFLLYIKYVFIY